MKQNKLTIVTPAFNEEEVIRNFYQQTEDVLSTLSGRYQTCILFVVDRCTDNTLGILREIAEGNPRVQILSLSARFGHQMSLLAGIDHTADADIIIMMDSDLQHPPELIPELLRYHELGNDVVFTVRQNTKDVGLLRKLVGKIFYRLLGYLSDAPINENAADFRLVSRRVADLLRSHIRERNMFLRGLFSWVGFNQASVEYVARKRAAGKSKYSLSRMFKLAIAGIVSFSIKPLKISILVGVIFAVMSFFLGVFTVVGYFLDDTYPSGWTTIVVLLLFFSGVNLIFMGILSIYIGGIYEEVKARPHYIIDEAINITNGKS